MESRRKHRANLKRITRLRQAFGDLNTAHVALHRKVFGPVTISAVAQDIGVSRDTVRRALQKLSDSATPNKK
jgi:predicted transcriptional regulator